MQTKTLPFVPSNHLLGHFSSIFKDPVEFLSKNSRHYGDRFSFRLGTKKVAFFSHPDDLKQIFIDHKDVFLKSSTRSSFGSSVLTSEGDKWKELRKGAQAFFQHSNLDKSVADVDEVIMSSINQLQKDSSSLPMQSYFDRLIEGIVLKLFFDEANLGPTDHLGEKVYFLSDKIIKMGLFPKRPPKWFPLFGIREFYTTLDGFSDRMYELYKSNLVGGQCPFKTFSQVISGEMKDQKEIQNQLLSFFFAGFETTVNALFWSFYLLLKNPKVLKQVEDEVLNFQVTDGMTYKEVLSALPLTEASLLEGMRLYPPVWFRTRTAEQSATVSGYHVEKNSLVWVSQAITHRHPEFWDQPNEYLPERFLSKTKIHPYQYFPFSLGKNICQGRDLAMLEMVLTFARLFQNFDFTLANGADRNLHPVARVSLRPNQELFVEKKIKTKAQILKKPAMSEL